MGRDRGMLLGLVVVSVAIASGCGSDAAAPGGDSCVGGVTVACSCALGVQGAALCVNGSFGACMCNAAGSGGLGGSSGVGGSGGTGGVGGTGGDAGTGGVGGTGGEAGTGGVGGTGGDAGTGGVGGTGGEDLPRFSFFVTSLEIMRELSGSQNGFGGNLGGITGADSICQRAADKVGFGAKTWRAFLSVTDGGNGQPIHAIDRIGAGPWYDANERLVADNIAGLLAGDRPAGNSQTVNDLPNEFGQGLMAMGDTHDILTGSNTEGRLDSTEPANTCNNWTSTTAVPVGGGFGGFPPMSQPGGLRIGHSWPAMSGQHWIMSHAETSCAAGVNLVQNGPGNGSSAGGGWGGFYCFALTP